MSKEDSKKEEKLDTVAEKFIKTRQILLSGEINKELAEKINKQLLVLEADSKDPIYVYIDSPGGDVSAGFAIFDMIRFVNSPVITIGNGLIASAASLILLAVPKERRVGFAHSSYLIHQPLVEARGVATDLQIQAEEMAKTKKEINQIISEQTGKKFAQVEKDTNRDYWLNAEEAVKYGLIGSIVTSRKELEAIK